MIISLIQTAKYIFNFFYVTKLTLLCHSGSVSYCKYQGKMSWI